MVYRKYLEDINCQYIKEDTYGEDDPQHVEKWKTEREEYGFDSRDTWNMDTIMLELLYERLKMYMEVNIVDLEYHTITIGEEEKNLQEWVELILQLCEDVLSNKEDYGTFAWYKNQLDTEYNNNVKYHGLFDKDDETTELDNSSDIVNVNFVEDEEGKITLEKDTYTPLTHWLKTLEYNVECDIQESKKEIWTIWAHINNHIWW